MDATTRQIVLDTETTGLEPNQGHRIIEIGCIELQNRRQTGNNFHVFLNPDRPIDRGAVEVHGITDEFLSDKPRFAEVAAEFLRYIDGAELVIHNAAFDVGFLNAELSRLADGSPAVDSRCRVLDTLALARQAHPGQKNSLDALCKRYQVDNSRREFHGALLDAQLLAEVYLAMTGGQTAMALDEVGAGAQFGGGVGLERLLSGQRPVVILATDDEVTAHESRLEAVRKAAGGSCLWDALQPAV
jgi:DNA polymerase-3 subunit epsilon